MISMPPSLLRAGYGDYCAGPWVCGQKARCLARHVSRNGCVLLLVVHVFAAVAHAQGAPSFRGGQFIVSGGATLAGGYPVGDITASIRRNAPGPSTPFTMLRAESEFEPAASLEGRVGFAVTESLGIEVTGTYARPQLSVTVSQDPELVSAAFVSERIDQFGLDASALYHLPVALGRRGRAYVIGGAGYLRQLHEGRLLVETGRTFHVGAGVHYWLRGLSRGHPLGVRGEARYVRRSGAIDFEDRSRGFASVSALAFIAF